MGVDNRLIEAEQDDSEQNEIRNDERLERIKDSLLCRSRTSAKFVHHFENLRCSLGGTKVIFAAILAWIAFAVLLNIISAFQQVGTKILGL
jgi:hypothetical protein